MLASLGNKCEQTPHVVVLTKLPKHTESMYLGHSSASGEGVSEARSQKVSKKLAFWVLPKVRKVSKIRGGKKQ